MGYERRPFNPTTPYPNQVIVELNKANDNYDILAQAFVSDNPETLTVKNADTVDGFHASPTSTPNTIPVALDTGKLHLDWLPDGIGGYGYKRIDLTNATTDYDLQLGEEAYYEWNTTTTSNLPLRIQVSGKLYQLIIISPRGSSVASVSLYPNNTSYTNAFKVKGISTVGSSVELFSTTLSTMPYYDSNGGGITVSWIQTMTKNKSMWHISTLRSPNFPSAFYIISIQWNDTTVVWSSLGTLTTVQANDTLYVLVRRVI